MKWGIGLKSGAVAGAIYGVLIGILSLAITILMKDEVLEMINAQFAKLDNVPITAEQIYPMTLAAAIPNGIIMGVILGLILGVVFFLLHEELPGKGPKKGVFFAILLLIAAGLAELIAPGFGLSLLLIQTQFPVFIPVGIAFFLIFGFLLGKFYEKFK